MSSKQRNKSKKLAATSKVRCNHYEYSSVETLKQAILSSKIMKKEFLTKIDVLCIVDIIVLCVGVLPCWSKKYNKSMMIYTHNSMLNSLYFNHYFMYRISYANLKNMYSDSISQPYSVFLSHNNNDEWIRLKNSNNNVKNTKSNEYQPCLNIYRYTFKLLFEEDTVMTNYNYRYGYNVSSFWQNQYSQKQEKHCVSLGIVTKKIEKKLNRQKQFNIGRDCNGQSMCVEMRDEMICFYYQDKQIGDKIEFNMYKFIYGYENKYQHYKAMEDKKDNKDGHANDDGDKMKHDHKIVLEMDFNEKKMKLLCCNIISYNNDTKYKECNSYQCQCDIPNQLIQELVQGSFKVGATLRASNHVAIGIVRAEVE